jgi:uncharacterized protein (TIGR03435 family)
MGGSVLESAEEGNPPIIQMAHPMLQMLLEARCKLNVRTETRELPVYALTVAKGGTKLQASKEGGCVPFDIKSTLLPPVEPRPKFCGGTSFKPNG